MATREQTATERVLAERDRYVARGIAAASIVVDRAEGARVWDVDGRSYVDFAGGIACQNTGHGFEPVVAAIHEQADRYLHQCFMVGAYEPYVEPSASGSPSSRRAARASSARSSSTPARRGSRTP